MGKILSKYVTPFFVNWAAFFLLCLESSLYIIARSPFRNVPDKYFLPVYDKFFLSSNSVFERSSQFLRNPVFFCLFVCFSLKNNAFKVFEEISANSQIFSVFS